MNGIHEVTGSIPVWSTNLRSRSQAKVAHRSAKREGGLSLSPRELRLARQMKVVRHSGTIRRSSRDGGLHASPYRK